ncbi:Os12g0418900, partial [Oryza sativa Japonica Group]
IRASFHFCIFPRSLLVNRSTKEAVETEEVAIHNRQRQRDAAAASRATAAYPYSRHRSSCAERYFQRTRILLHYKESNQS